MIVLRIFTVLISLLVAGEATALAIRMHIIKKSESPWISLKNDLLMSFDIVVGLVLILLANDSRNFPQPLWFPLFIILGVLTHLFRVWEILAGHQNPFCRSRLSFLLNNLKFIGLIIILVWGVLV